MHTFLMFSTKTQPDGCDTIILFTPITTKHLYNMLTTCMPNSACYKKSHKHFCQIDAKVCTNENLSSRNYQSLSEMKPCLFENFCEGAQQLHQALK